MVMKFIWLHDKYGIPRRLVSDNGRQFVGQKLKEWCEGYDIHQAFTSEGTGATPFHLVYGGEAVVPVEVGVESNQIQHYNENNAERRPLELDLVDEARAKAALRLMAYRHRMKQSYNRRVIPRSFQVDELVWMKVKSVGYVTKLEAPWAGPFRVVEKLRSGAYYLDDEDGR
ncbi:uncharacterized protein LOC121986954 [Zingiber officinale]|uniref:uncharacterized protein LOC121986954 n=1 Tax=Zingiber officinale TaxID=94328 RepID=UPI001C4D8B13|nr:uncharacterized protein LOC121986954 [Zingiber officinale]